MLQAIRQHRSVRVAAVVAALLAWVAMSNHCVLAAFASAHGRTQGHHCCERTTPPEQPPAPAPLQCCKSLQVLVPETAKLTVLQLAAGLLPVWLAAFDADAESGMCAAHCDIGPPLDSPTFVELVLHRSLPSLAPPLRA
jgi:hypothetical protein